MKHVEVPQRVSETPIVYALSDQPAHCVFSQSPFSRDCPQRPFECMISTLRKLPWYKTECITIKQRYSVYSACIQLIRLLQHAIKEKKNEDHLTLQLLKRLWTSAMLCHGFTVTMRDNIAYQVDMPEDRLREFNMPRFANMWVHAYTLSPKPGTPLDVLEVRVLPFLPLSPTKVATLLTRLSLHSTTLPSFARRPIARSAFSSPTSSLRSTTRERRRTCTGAISSRSSTFPTARPSTT